MREPRMSKPFLEGQDLGFLQASPVMLAWGTPFPRQPQSPSLSARVPLWATCLG